MRKSYRTFRVTRHPKDNKSKATSSLFLFKMNAKLERDINYCIPKQRTTQKPHKQWEVHKTINQQQQYHRLRTDSRELGGDLFMSKKSFVLIFFCQHLFEKILLSIHKKHFWQRNKKNGDFGYYH